MSWKKRYAVAAEERDMYWQELVAQDAMVIDLEFAAYQNESDISQLKIENANLSALLWETVAEVNRLRDSLRINDLGYELGLDAPTLQNEREAQRARADALAAQVSNLANALILDEEGGKTVPTWVTDSVLDIVSLNEGIEQGYYVMLRKTIAKYAATALDASADNGDQYAAQKIKDALK